MVIILRVILWVMLYLRIYVILLEYIIENCVGIFVSIVIEAIFFGLSSWLIYRNLRKRLVETALHANERLMESIKITTQWDTERRILSRSMECLALALTSGKLDGNRCLQNLWGNFLITLFWVDEPE